jgi:hypothetical protein
VRPELTTASVVRGLDIDHDRRCWTTLHLYKPAPIALIYRGQTVQINRATSECRLTGKDWYSLAERLRDASKLRRLEFGGKIEISESGLESISSAIASRDSSLRELVIDDLSMDQFSFDKLSKAIKKTRKFLTYKLAEYLRKSIDW